MYGDPYVRPDRRFVDYGVKEFGTDKHLGPDFTIGFPFSEVRKLGLEDDMYAEDLLLFLELHNPKVLNVYFARSPTRQISKQKVREISKEIDELFPDELLG